MNCYFLAGHFAADQDGKITPLQMMIETREPLHYSIYIALVSADKVEALQFSENSPANCFLREHRLIKRYIIPICGFFLYPTFDWQ
jgi:hypothetical protein